MAKWPSYVDDLPGGDMTEYVDPRIDRQWWRIHRADIEGQWLVSIMPLLRAGPAITSELAAAAGVKPGTEYGRFLSMLERHRNAGRFIKAGQRKGRLHLNNIWRLDMETAR